MSGVSEAAQNFNWLLVQFVNDTFGVSEAVAVSSDGILLAASAGRGTGKVEQFAAITSGLTSLTKGAAACFDFDSVSQVIVEMSGGYLFISSISDGSALGVLATGDCDIGLIGYEMTLLVDRCGEVLTPSLIAELKNTLAV